MIKQIVFKLLICFLFSIRVFNGLASFLKGLDDKPREKEIQRETNQEVEVGIQELTLLRLRNLIYSVL